VLAKGGVVLDGPDAVDVFYDGQQTVHLSSPKIGEHRVSGAGCTLAAAVTAELAKGAAPLEAAQVAKAIVTSSIENRQECHTSFVAVFQGVYQRCPRRARVPRGPGRRRGTRARLCMPALSFWREGRRAGGRGTSRWWERRVFGAGLCRRSRTCSEWWRFVPSPGQGDARDRILRAMSEHGTGSGPAPQAGLASSGTATGTAKPASSSGAAATRKHT